MSLKKPALALYVCAAAALLVVATGSQAQTSAKAPAMIAEGVLVAPGGMTLYTFDKDTAGSGKSACNGPCATLWPPLMAAAADLPAGNYTIVIRDDGSRQWAYKGKPLYTYKSDQKAGDRTGDNFRDAWHIVKE